MIWVHPPPGDLLGEGRVMGYAVGSVAEPLNYYAASAQLPSYRYMVRQNIENKQKVT
jgi:hypothetical protein